MDKKEIEQILYKIQDAKKEIKEIENRIKNDNYVLKNLIIERLKMREDILDKYNVSHSGYGNPCASSSNLVIKNINIKEDLSISFDWYDSWAYGGEDFGSFSLSKEELIAGDFSILEEKYSKLKEKKKDKNEEFERLEYERLKKKFENK